MDPNETLRQLRSMVADAGDEASAEWLLDNGDRFVELFDGLDGWLSKGGFPPEEWRH